MELFGVLAAALLVLFSAAARAWFIALGLAGGLNRFDRRRQRLLVLAWKLLAVLLLAFLAIVKPFPPGVAWFVHGGYSCSFRCRPFSGVAIVDTIHALNANILPDSRAACLAGVGRRGILRYQI